MDERGLSPSHREVIAPETGLDSINRSAAPSFAGACTSPSTRCLRQLVWATDVVPAGHRSRVVNTPRSSSLDSLADPLDPLSRYRPARAVTSRAAPEGYARLVQARWDPWRRKKAQKAR